MERHLRIAGILFLVLAGVNVGICLLAYYFGDAAHLVDFSRSPNDFFVSTPLLAFLAFLMLVYSLILVVPLVITGVAILRMTSWAQGVATLVSTFTLLSIPLGTVVGGYALWVLMADETALIFRYQAKSDRSMSKSR
ncbi:MAG: hypothetical protein NTY38_14285 [Acidobacteria bacterium]|nr:hypothetical protein [Acidobacteriota bacterium]